MSFIQFLGSILLKKTNFLIFRYCSFKSKIWVSLLYWNYKVRGAYKKISLIWRRNIHLVNNSVEAQPQNHIQLPVNKQDLIFSVDIIGCSEKTHTVLINNLWKKCFKWKILEFKPLDSATVFSEHHIWQK